MREPEGERDGDGGGGAGVAGDTEVFLGEAVEDQVNSKDDEEEEELAQPDDQLPARRVEASAAQKKTCATDAPTSTVGHRTAPIALGPVVGWVCRHPTRVGSI